jgi:hypothetical protein
MQVHCEHTLVVTEKVSPGAAAMRYMLAATYQFTVGVGTSGLAHPQQCLLLHHVRWTEPDCAISFQY